MNRTKGQNTSFTLCRVLGWDGGDVVVVQIGCLGEEGGGEPTNLMTVVTSTRLATW